MYFPEHDGHGDWRLVGLGGFTTVGSPHTDDFITTGIGHNYTAQYATPRVLHYY
jgi:hypothetical protein